MKKSVSTTLYKDIWCNVIEQDMGKYLILHKATERCKQPPDVWAKSFEYGFDENLPGVHSLYVASYKDYKRTKVIEIGISKGYFELLGRRIYAMEFLIKPYNVPRFYQLSEKEYNYKYIYTRDTEFINSITKRKAFASGFNESGKCYFSLLDVDLEKTVPVLKENVNIEHEFKLVKKKDGSSEVIAVFPDSKYEILPYFLSYEVSVCKDWIIKEIEAVLIEPYKHRVILTGKSCKLDITSTRTIIECTVDDIEIGNACEIGTKDFKNLILEWLNLLKKI